MKPKTVGFGLLGRTFGEFDKPDVPVAHDARLLLERLAKRHEDVEWVVFSPSRETPLRLPNVSSPWLDVKISDLIAAENVAIDAITPCEAVVVFVNGVSSVSVRDCAKISTPDQYVTPLVSASRTSSATINALNAWIDADPTRDPVYVVNDARTSLCARDLKWPPRQSILAQFFTVKEQLHYRYGDERSAADFDLMPVPVFEEKRGHWEAFHYYEAADIPFVVL